MVPFSFLQFSVSDFHLVKSGLTKHVFSYVYAGELKMQSVLFPVISSFPVNVLLLEKKIIL